MNNILEDPHLLKVLIDECSKRIAGERDTIKTIILFAALKWVKNHKGSSSNVILNDVSSSGKDYILKNVLDLFPEDDVVTFGKMSPQAVAYLKADEKWSWDGKILYISEIADSTFNDKTFVSFSVTNPQAKFKSVIVDKGKQKEFTVRGKPIIFCTSSDINPKTDLLRRFSFINLDVSNEQSRRVMEKNADIRYKDVIYDKMLKEALQKLERHKVKIPFEHKLLELIQTQLKETPIILRTKWNTFVDLVAASAALHQMQRKREDEFIIATLEDWEHVRPLLERMTKKGLTPLTRKEQRLLDIVKANIPNEKIDDEIPKIFDSVIVSDILSKQNFISHHKTLQKYLNNLAEKGYLHTEERTIINNRIVTAFSPSPITVLKFPTKEMIENTELTDNTNITKTDNVSKDNDVNKFSNARNSRD